MAHARLLGHRDQVRRGKQASVELLRPRTSVGLNLHSKFLSGPAFTSLQCRVSLNPHYGLNMTQNIALMLILDLNNLDHLSLMS